MPPSPLDVVHLVVALVELSDRVHPPVDVAPAVVPRQANVLADGDHDVPTAASRSSSAICTPEADAPTTSTRPSTSTCSGRGTRAP